MPAHYAFKADPKANLMTIIMSGFFQPSDISAFSGDLARAFESLPEANGQHVTLVDIRQMDIQSQDAVAGFQHLLQNSRFKSRRIAFVVAKTLARLQIKRAAEGREPAFFSDMDEARVWLLAKD